MKRSLTLFGGSLWLVSCVLNPQGEDPGFEEQGPASALDGTPPSGPVMGGVIGEPSSAGGPAVDPVTGSPVSPEGPVNSGGEQILDPEPNAMAPVPVVPPGVTPGDTNTPIDPSPSGAGGGGFASGGTSAAGGSPGSAGGAGGSDDTDDFDAGPFNYASEDDAGTPDGGAGDAGAPAADGDVDGGVDQ